MICLSCRTEIAGNPPLSCPGCGLVHESRPPVVGVNHLSQLLCALDFLAAGDCSPDEFETVFTSFVEQLDELERKWQLRDSTLSERLSSGLRIDFAAYFAQLDEALQAAFQGVECVEAYFTEEADSMEQAEECFVRFFLNVCAASAGILSKIDKLSSSSDKLVN